MYDDDGTCLVCGLEDAPEDHEHEAEIMRDGWRGQYLAPTLVLDIDAITPAGSVPSDVLKAASRWLDTMGPAVDETAEDDCTLVLDWLSDHDYALLDEHGWLLVQDDGYAIYRAVSA